MHFMGAGDYTGASCFQHDPPRWNPPFPPPLEGTLTRDEWADFFLGLNAASSQSVDPQCFCCPKPCGGVAGNGWKRGVKAYLSVANGKLGGRVQWSYERHLEGGGQDARTVHNRLDLTWNPNVAAAVVATEAPAVVAGTVVATEAPAVVVAAAPVVQQMERPAGTEERLQQVNDLLAKGLISEGEAADKRAAILQDI